MQPKDLRLATEQDLENSIGAATAPLDQRLEDLEVSAGFTPGDINDTTAASLIRNPESETATELSAAIVERQARVTVGATGEYPTLAAALAAYPSGGVHVELFPGLHSSASTITPTGAQKYVTITGQGRGSTTVDSPEGFINAPMNADEWKIRDFTVQCTTHENAFDGIKADYPRRWDTDGVRFAGFGGTSLWYRGGIQSRMGFNYALAKDSANVNGFAGFRCDKSSTGVVATVFRSEQNYVGTGKEYGYFFDGINVGSVFDQDTAELCDVGMRFQQCWGELRSPYTEANRIAGIQSHDSTLNYSGRFRDMPATTWASVAGEDRSPVFIGHTAINPGKALIFGPNTGPTNDPSAYVSVRHGSQDPNGLFAGVPGSLYLRTVSANGRVLYVKETGTGNTGWVPMGTQSRANSQFNSAADSINTSGKRAGVQVWDTSVNRPVWASGPAATDPWYHADGTLAHTPV